uniref:Uncharacterized protein n=1 Tax=Micrococcus phage Kurnik TaxID=3092208 RepID=A0AAU6R644_9CAUD
MRHQFIGGPLDGKVRVFTSDEEVTAVPWEEYVRDAEVSSSVDGVLETLVWRARTQTPEYANLVAAIGAQPGDVITVTLPREPVDGGYDTVKASLDGHVQERVEITAENREERLRELQRDAESRITGAALRERGFVPENHPGDGSSNASPATADLTPERVPVPDVQVETTENSIQVTGPEMGDYGTLPGENIWDTFEERRKKVKGFPRWQWGSRLVEGGSSSLGDRLEKGKVTNSDAKKLGLESIDAVYLSADALLRELGV